MYTLVRSRQTLQGRHCDAQDTTQPTPSLVRSCLISLSLKKMFLQSTPYTSSRITWPEHIRLGMHAPTCSQQPLGSKRASPSSIAPKQKMGDDSNGSVEPKAKHDSPHQGRVVYRLVFQDPARAKKRMITRRRGPPPAWIPAPHQTRPIALVYCCKVQRNTQHANKTLAAKPYRSSKTHRAQTSCLVLLWAGSGLSGVNVRDQNDERSSWIK